jgi:DNA-binding CsgD family transcriptional regulator
MNARLRPPGLYTTLGEIARTVGRSDFYERLASAPAEILGCDRWLVVRYSRYALPEFLVNRAMSDAAVDFYFQRLYRLDPLLRLARTGPEAGVVSLRRLRMADSENAYFDDLFRSAWIFDELNLLFTMPGRVTIALCFDRSDRAFDESEIAEMEAIYPLFEGLHEAHLDATFRLLGEPSVWQQQLPNPNRCVQILDRGLRRIYATSDWLDFERESDLPLNRFIHRNRNRGVVSLNRDLVLHWDRLPANFAPAPEGTICLIEERRMPDVKEGFDVSIRVFGENHDLTPREQEIVALVFRGYPNELIAQKLGVSAGTVRNHRHRLYYKLDITTERELFNMFISHLTADSS